MSTVTVLVASQLLCGLAVETVRNGVAVNASAKAGAALLVIGTVLVLSRG